MYLHALPNALVFGSKLCILQALTTECLQQQYIKHELMDLVSNIPCYL